MKSNSHLLGRLTTFLIPLTALLLSLHSTRAADEPPPQIELRDLPEQSRMIQDVLVPVPSEIFNALDKYSKPNWRRVQRMSLVEAKVPGTQAEGSLLLGIVVAEGFIAVEAEDAVQVKEIGRRVLALARTLNVEKSILRRSNSIIEYANERAWGPVRKELDGVLLDVRESMIELNSESLSQLVSLGGWLRGTEALADVLSSDYSPRGAELLSQPVLLEYFDTQLSEMQPKLRAKPAVSRMLKGVVELRPLMSSGPGAVVSETDVAKIRETVASLVKNVTGHP